MTGYQMPFQLPLNRFLLATLVLVGTIAIVQGAGNLSGLKLFVLEGHSMEPTIMPGSLVVAREVPAKDITVGDLYGDLDANVRFRSPYRSPPLQ